MKCGDLVEICLWAYLAVKGLKLLYEYPKHKCKLLVYYSLFIILLHTVIHQDSEKNH